MTFFELFGNTGVITFFTIFVPKLAFHNRLRCCPATQSPVVQLLVRVFRAFPLEEIQSLFRMMAQVRRWQSTTREKPQAGHLKDGGQTQVTSFMYHRHSIIFS